MLHVLPFSWSFPFFFVRSFFSIAHLELEGCLDDENGMRQSLDESLFPSMLW
jgi:hypothetical protein